MEPFVRWQEITRSQLSYTINLILGLTIGIIGFALVRLSDATFLPTGCIKFLITSSILVLLISAITSIILIINRLIDFSKTTSISRESGKAITNDLNNKREETKKIGRVTWCLFWIQIGTFGYGILSMVIGLLLIYKDKLF